MSSPNSMQNLLTEPLSETQLARILAASAAPPMLPPLDNPTWRSLRDHPAVSAWSAPLVQQAMLEIDQPLPPLPDELYADFFKTGARSPFENVYASRRAILGQRTMALLLLENESHRDRLVSALLRALEELMDEASWALPAHVWTEPSGKDAMTIDLCAAETANTLAEILAVFAAVIPAELGRRIHGRLRTQFFENYLNREPAFHWTELPMNWNAVCHQGVLGAALTIETDHLLVATLLRRTANALPIFLSGFGADGSTSEGPGYWSYGFGKFSDLNAQLEKRTAGQLSFFEGNDMISRIARFAPLMTFSEGHYVNFSDGPRRGRLNPALVTYLGERLADPFLASQGESLYRRLADAGLEPGSQRADFSFFSRLALRTPPREALAKAGEAAGGDVLFEDYGVMIARGKDALGDLWEFAAKAGHNAEHHNHNDCGSFILNVNGGASIVEIGAPQYVGDYFNSDRTRYQFLAARSLGHSVPLVNGFEQSAGAEFIAEVLASHLGADRAEFRIDLTRCYPPEAHCRSLVRTFIFERTAGRLEVTDDYVLDEPGEVESIVICEARTVVEATGLRIEAPGGNVWVKPVRPTEFVGVDTCDYHDKEGEIRQIQRLRFRRSHISAAATVSYQITHG